MATNISTITINASLQKVWAAITEAALVKRWQYGSDLVTNWEPGSSISFSVEWEGKLFKQWGTVLEITPCECVKYSLFAPRPDLEDLPENYFVMSYVLAAENGLTKLTITQEDNRPNAIQEAPQGEENPVLRSLKALAESL